MAPALPDDILHLLCEHLGDQQLFDVLFSCACASRSLAIPALTNLYRYVFMRPNRVHEYYDAIGKSILCNALSMYARTDILIAPTTTRLFAALIKMKLHFSVR